VTINQVFARHTGANEPCHAGNQWICSHLNMTHELTICKQIQQ